MVEVGPGRWTRCHHADRIGEILAAERTARASRAPTSHRVVLEMRDVSKTFRQQRHDVPALVGVDLGLEEGETLGLVGESGSGKSTLAKAMLGIHAPDAGGELEIDGQGRGRARPANRTADERRAVQMVFQNPDSALNRNWTVRRILKRAVDEADRRQGRAPPTSASTKLAESLRLIATPPRPQAAPAVGRAQAARRHRPRLRRRSAHRRLRRADERPRRLGAGGDPQRARRAPGRRKTSYLFISHDLGVVRYLGRPHRGDVPRADHGDRHAPTQIFDGPHHPYTEALLSAVPSVDGEPSTRISLAGEIPSPANPPSGCVFHTRCHRFMAGMCDVIEPPVVELSIGHRIRCHLPVDQLARSAGVEHDAMTGPRPAARR